MVFQISFKPFKYGNGLTFLLPSDKSHIKLLADLYNSDKVDDVEDIIKSLLITFYISNISEFNSKKDDISNKLDKSIEIESVKGDTVKLKDGSTITPYPLFKPGKNNIAVYKLSGTLLPLTGPPAKHLYDKPIAKKQHGVAGGCDIGKDIKKFTKHIECRYWQKSCEAKEKEGVPLSENTYLEVVSSFLEFLSASKHPAQQAEYITIMAVIDTSPKTNYYLIFRPYGSRRLISQDTLSKFIKVCHNSVSVFKRIYNDATTRNTGLVADRSTLLSAIEQKRQSILSNTSKASIYKAIKDTYDDLRTNNRIIMLQFILMKYTRK